MKNKLIILALFLVTIPLATANRDFNKDSFGQGVFGKNSDPIIDAFDPSDLTPSINFSVINVTFNVTFNDADSDRITINWTINGTHNRSNSNLSILLNDSLGQVLNITSNVSDNLSHVFTIWIVTVINDTVEIAVEAEPGPKNPKFYWFNQTDIFEPLNDLAIAWIDFFGNMWLKSNLNVTKNLTVGTRTEVTNITIYSPNSLAWNCGVNDSGDFSCSQR